MIVILIGLALCSVVGGIGGLVVGLIMGMEFSWIAFIICFGFSMDVAFNGTKDGMK